MKFTDLFYQNDEITIKGDLEDFLAANSTAQLYFTANFGSYSNLSPLIECFSGANNSCLVIFSDARSLRPFKLKKNNILIISLDPIEGKDPRLAAKFFKILPHRVLPSRRSCIWVDSNLSITRFPSYSELAGDSDVAVFSHDKRVNVLQEIEECKRHGKDTNANLLAAMSLYRGVIPDFLAQGRIIFRSNSGDVTSFNEQWWESVVATSIRDQLTLPLALRASGVNFKLMDNTLRTQFFKIHLHSKVWFSHKGYLENIIATIKNWGLLIALRLVRR